MRRRVMHCALRWPFYGGPKMAVLRLGRTAPMSNPGQIPILIKRVQNKITDKEGDITSNEREKLMFSYVNTNTSAQCMWLRLKSGQ